MDAERAHDEYGVSVVRVDRHARVEDSDRWIRLMMMSVLRLLLVRERRQGGGLQAAFLQNCLSSVSQFSLHVYAFNSRTCEF